MVSFRVGLSVLHANALGLSPSLLKHWTLVALRQCKSPANGGWALKFTTHFRQLTTHFRQSGICILNHLDNWLAYFSMVSGHARKPQTSPLKFPEMENVYGECPLYFSLTSTSLSSHWAKKELRLWDQAVLLFTANLPNQPWFPELIQLMR